MNHQEIRSILKMLDAVERKDCYLKMLSSEMNQYVYENGLINCYKPKTISKLRNLMGISELNLSGNYIFNKKIHSNSGSVFFFSGDFKYVIKTIRESELKTLLKYINSYYLYLENNPSTYLLRIVGCYTLINPSFCTLGCIKTKCTHTHNVLIMKNIFENTKIDKIYDLKGMALARGTNNYIKKDMDWYEDNRKLVITNSELDQLRKDMIFLENQNIMDYSLMVYYPGTRKDSHFELFNMKNRKTYTVSKDLRSSDKPFFIGIVDILTDYDCIKKVEYLWNTFCICKNKSCLNPKDYRERLFNLIEDTSTVEE